MLVIADDLSGIFVRGIADGSAAALDGRIQLHDQIIAVCIYCLEFAIFFSFFDAYFLFTDINRKCCCCVHQVDGMTLDGCSNQKAVELLRGTGRVIHLKLARYRSGPKYEQLVQAAAQGIYWVSYYYFFFKYVTTDLFSFKHCVCLV